VKRDSEGSTRLAGTPFEEIVAEGARAIGIDLARHQLSQCRQYAEHLSHAQRSVNLTAIGSPTEIAVKHFVDSICAVRSAALLSARTIVDVGSGAGFPAVPLAIALPQARVIAVESRAKRAAFVEKSAHECGIENLIVQAARSEELGRGQLRDACDAAVFRALADPAASIELCLPLVRPGGILVALVGARDALLATDLSPVAEKLGGQVVGGSEYRLPILGHARGIIEVLKTVATPPRFPRRAGAARRQPLQKAWHSRTCPDAEPG